MESDLTVTEATMEMMIIPGMDGAAVQHPSEAVTEAIPAIAISVPDQAQPRPALRTALIILAAILSFMIIDLCYVFRPVSFNDVVLICAGVIGGFIFLLGAFAVFACALGGIVKGMVWTWRKQFPAGRHRR